MPHDNPFLNALIGESWWAAGGDNVVTYNFAEDYGAAWNAPERAAFDAVFRAYEAVCNIKFVETSRADAEIVENKVTRAQMVEERPGEAVWHGWHDEPGPGTRYGFYDYTRNYWDDSLGKGGNAYWLILHEIGHAIGLEHPHSDWHGSGLFPGVTNGASGDPGTYGLNDVRTTAMSYRLTDSASPAIGQIAGPMAFDIAALQELYGAVEAQTGDNVYKLGANHWRCIWDTGGVDQFVFEGSRDAVIDLRPATLALAPGGGGWLSYAKGINGGFTIANGVTIENARGGSGDDILVGNGADNLLDGRSGNDRLTAGNGDDRLYGYSGIDVLRSGGGDDVVFGGVGNDRLEGSYGADVLVGGAGADKIHLGVDGDRDVVVAGQADRIFQFDSGKDKIDLSRFDPDSVWIGEKDGRWTVTVDYDNDRSHEIEFTVYSNALRMSDFIL